MNSSEFQEWMRYHRKAYPGLAAWLEKNDGQADMWAKVLGKTPLDAAKRATDTLFEQEDQPRGYGEHPRAIKRLAWETRTKSVPRKVDGQDTYSCRRCRDSGMVSVVSAASLRAAWANHRDHGIRWCAVACDCAAGERFAFPPKGVRGMLRWKDNTTLFSWDDVIEHARTIDEGMPDCHLFEAVRQLLMEHDQHKLNGDSIDDVQLAGTYQGDAEEEEF
jgi:hypothetical protein